MMRILPPVRNSRPFMRVGHPGWLRPLVVLAATLSILGLVRAAPADADLAARAVRGWLAGRDHALGTPLGQTVQRTETFPGRDGAPAYHVVYLEPRGFVIVPADDRVTPIVAWVGGGEFSADDRNPLGYLVRHDLAWRLGQARQPATTRGDGKLTAIQQEWARLLERADMPAKDVPRDTISDVRVAPLLTNTWGQTTAGFDNGNPISCYNWYTPPGPTGSANNYPVGCVALSQSQIMRFWQYPTTGVGTASFNITVNGNSQSRQLRGGDGNGGPYDWANMPMNPDSTTTNAQRQAIGALCHDAGLPVGADYTDGLTSAPTTEVPGSLKDTFHYANAVVGYNGGQDLGDIERNRMINPNLDAGFPCIVSLSSAQFGHAAVVDGYGFESEVLYHHLNLGWYGQYDVWYDLPDVPAQDIADFNTTPECVYNIYVTGSGEIVSGRVVDATGNPLVGATVTAVGGGQNYQTTTNARGVYAFAKILASTTYTVTVTSNGYTAVARTVTTGSSADFGDCGNRWAVDFLAVAGGSGTVTVHLAPAEAVAAGARWRLVGAGWRSPWIESDATTAAPVGGCSVEFEPITRWAPPAAQSITVTQGQNTSTTGTYTATSRVRYVNAAATGTGDGTTWANAFTTLQAAITAAESGDDLWVAAGTYKPSGNGNRNAVFQLRGGIRIYGGFAGTETRRDQRDWRIHQTILSGDLSGNDNGNVVSTEATRQDNSIHIVVGADGGYLDGVTITGGNSTERGGALYSLNSSLTIANCTFTANTAPALGGAVYDQEGTPVFTACTFANNICDGAGGAVVILDSNATFDGCTFSGNRATNQAGAMLLQQGTQQILDCSFTGNSAANVGGAILNVFNTAQYTACTFVGNAADNAADNAGGGAMFTQQAEVTLTNCELRGNTAEAGGGGHYGYLATVTAVNCTFAGNTAHVGADLRHDDCDAVTITNSICWSPQALYAGGTSAPVVTYSCVNGGATGAGNIAVDPQFTDFAGGDLSLRSTSPCRNTGTATGAPTDDLRGLTRDAQPDMGAYEYGGTSPNSLPFTFVVGYQTVGLPMTDTGLDSAADVLAEVPHCTAVYRYDSAARQWVAYTGPTDPDFTLQVGAAYMVHCSATGSATMTGTWATGLHRGLDVGYNLLCLPKDKETVNTAAKLLADVGAIGVWKWDKQNQRWLGYAAGFGGTDFAVAAGDAVLVALRTHTVWP